MDMFDVQRDSDMHVPNELELQTVVDGLKKLESREECLRSFKHILQNGRWINQDFSKLEDFHDFQVWAYTLYHDRPLGITANYNGFRNTVIERRLGQIIQQKILDHKEELPDSTLGPPDLCQTMLELLLAAPDAVEILVRDGGVDLAKALTHINFFMGGFLVELKGESMVRGLLLCVLDSRSSMHEHLKCLSARDIGRMVDVLEREWPDSRPIDTIEELLKMKTVDRDRLLNHVADVEDEYMYFLD